VIERPQTHYTSLDDADIVYQVMGDGPVDLLFFFGLGFSTQTAWQVPTFIEFCRRLAPFSRLIFFDRRGVGGSDAVPHNAMPTWESLAEDAGAVLDSLGSPRATIYATLEGGPMALLFAATHPDRVSALLLVNTTARYLVADDYPIGVAAEVIDWVVDTLRDGWGTADLVRLIDPSITEDIALLEQLATNQRSSATPRSAAAQYDYLLRNMDVRQVLPLINVPTLVIHSLDNLFVPVEQGRYLADHIAGAKFIGLPGADIGFAAFLDRAADEVAELLTGERPPDIERVLATVLFTDIADSTAKAASLGDRRWRAVLDAHDKTVREQLRRFRGREIKTTGDGFLVSFEGPARAIRCARAICEATSALGVEVRAGLHTGECDVRGDDLGGLAVHIASRVGAMAGPGEVLVSGTVKDLVVGSGIEFEDRGEHKLKGVPGSWKLLAVGA
jgi:class 3 adenylate cyclase/pimeloyl-ACP methyl ester carboxylesterase